MTYFIEAWIFREIYFLLFYSFWKKEIYQGNSKNFYTTPRCRKKSQNSTFLLFV